MRPTTRLLVTVLALLQGISDGGHGLEYTLLTGAWGNQLAQQTVTLRETVRTRPT
jgi:hypothetical protein